MIRAIGVDSVDIKRFEHWRHYTKKQLSKIFHPHEIEYCLSSPVKAAERLAVRFAAKEAFFKAFSVLIMPQQLPLATLCRYVSITHTHHTIPLLQITWSRIWVLAQLPPQELITHISLTHSQTSATAFVIITTQ